MDSKPRWIVFALLATALISFFFPLVSVQIPLLGNQNWSGYDAISRMGSLERQLAPDNHPNSNTVATLGQSASAPPLDIPFSIQHLALVPLEVAAAFTCAAFSLLLLLANSRILKLFASLGAVAALIAIIHISVANSDLHSWIQSSLSSETGGQTDPFSQGMAKIGGLIANSVQLNPGWGMFLVAAALAISAVIVISQPKTQIEETPIRGGGFITAGE